MKKLSLLKSIFLLFALIAGSANTWAQSTEWVKTDIGSLTNDDVVVVVETAKYNRALKNTEATGSGSVKASDVLTLSADGSKITSEVSTEIQWVFSGNTESYTLKSNDTGARQLWCRDNNDALRVKATSPGTAYVGTFTWDSDYKMMKSTSLTRYAGVWNNSGDYQWRAYNSQTGANIKGCETSFYKKVTSTKTGTTTTIDASGITNTDVYASTVAGTLTASVTSGGSAIAGASVTWTSSNEAVATVAANGAVTLKKAGVTTIKASYAGDETYGESFDTYELTVTNSDSTEPLFYESFDNYTDVGGNDGTWNASSSTAIASKNNNILTDNAGWAFSTTYPANKCVKINTSNSQGSMTTPTISFVAGKVYTITFKAGGWKNDTGKTLNITTTAGTLDKSSIDVVAEEWNEYEIILAATGEGIITFEPEEAIKNRIYFDELTIKELNVTITPAKEYTTYVTPYALNFTGVEGLKAFVATAAESTGVILEEPTGAVPVNTPLVLKKESGTSFHVPVVASATAPATNLLKAGPADLTGDGTEYILSNGLFYQANAGTLAAGKAYLKVPAALARELVINWGETTGIGATFNDNVEMINDNVIYDLSGRRVENPTKGIYIMNGKKVVIR